MKFETIVKGKIQSDKNDSKLVTLIVLILNTVTTALLPFVVGFYFARTGNLMFFVVFLFMLLIEIRLEYQGGTITLKISR